jgi:hypothetical protein
VTIKPTAAAAAPTAAGRLGPGEFFGQSALLAPGSAFGASAAAAAAAAAQGADYVADSQRVVCLVMDKAEFERLLGPYEELWRWG